MSSTAAAALSNGTAAGATPSTPPLPSPLRNASTTAEPSVAALTATKAASSDAKPAAPTGSSEVKSPPPAKKKMGMGLSLGSLNPATTTNASTAGTEHDGCFSSASTSTSVLLVSFTSASSLLVLFFLCCSALLFFRCLLLCYSIYFLVFSFVDASSLSRYRWRKRFARRRRVAFPGELPSASQDPTRPGNQNSNSRKRKRHQNKRGLGSVRV